MVLGIGEGKLELSVNGTTFSPGQQIAGAIRLTMDESRQARGLRVEFYGLQKQGKHTVRICEVRQDLGGEREYRMGEQFNFSLTVPADTIPPKIDGFVGSIVAFLYNLSPPRWFIDASLDIPMKFDMNAKQRVQIIPAVGQPSVSAEQYAKDHGFDKPKTQTKTWSV